ncbi:MAG: serine protease [Bdellovibrio sp.]|nr:MAG: serine protease [Bdellovibrio sp.]
MRASKRIIASLLGLLLGTALSAGEKLYLQSGEVTLTEGNAGRSSLAQTLGGVNEEVSLKTQFFIVQFKNRITYQDQKFLKENGVEIFRYLPADALIVKAPRQLLKTLKMLNPSLRTFVPYFPRWRMSSQLFKSPYKKVLVRFFSEKKAKKALNTLESFGQVKEALGKSVVMDQVAFSQLENIAAIESVEWVQPYQDLKVLDVTAQELLNQSELDEPEVLRDPRNATGFETGTKVMDFEAAWNEGFTGEGQIVAMADTGLDKGSLDTVFEDFQGAILDGLVFGMFSKNWGDPMGHGTHVAGSVLGRGIASSGIFKGGAYGAQMVVESMWSKMLNNLTVPPELKDLFQPAYDKGARIHTNSWGKNNYGGYDNFAEQVDEFMWEHPDMLILFAAGNSGEDLDKDGRIDEGSVGSPATAKNAMAVGASENYLLEGGIQKALGELKGGRSWSVEPLKSDRLSDNAGGIAAFSSRGPTEDGRLKPDVVAPGTNIVSVCSSVEGASSLWGHYNEDYCYSGGTSMATPLAAGAVAILREVLVKKYERTNPSAALLKALILHTADDLYPGQFGEIGKENGQEILTPGPNIDQGFGRVNVAGFVDLSHLSLVEDNQVGVATGEEKVYNLPVPSHSLTLVYTDAPGAPAAEKQLTNNLDVEVTFEDGSTARLSDNVNNFEYLYNSPKAFASVKVIGVQVPMGKDGKQPYALIVE